MLCIYGVCVRCGMACRSSIHHSLFGCGLQYTRCVWCSGCKSQPLLTLVTCECLNAKHASFFVAPTIFIIISSIVCVLSTLCFICITLTLNVHNYYSFFVRFFSFLFKTVLKEFACVSFLFIWLTVFFTFFFVLKKKIKFSSIFMFDSKNHSKN